MYFRDFASGAMIENIVRRAKKLAIKRLHRRTEPSGINAPRTCWISVGSGTTPSTRICPTPPTPTTGPRSPVRRVSGSSSCARSCTATTPTPEADPSNGSAPASTCSPPVSTRTVSRTRGRSPRSVGIETEYGITHRGARAESNPVSRPPRCSSTPTWEPALAASHPAHPCVRVEWDFDRRDSRPLTPAASCGLELAMPPEPETHLVNAVLTNGARYYVDHAHPEICRSPECADARSVVLYDRAADLIAAGAL